jgi:hypothetical protein
MDKKYAYILYNKRSATTGRALFERLRDIKAGGYTWRHATKAPQKEPSFILRWGNSYIEAPTGCKEFNIAEAVANTTNKLRMLMLLNADANVNLPTIVWHAESGEPRPALTTDHFIRDVNDHVRHGHSIRNTDKYVLADVNKTQEFRVHIFNGKTMGVYEKLPTNANDAMWKDDNAEFRRRDMSETATKQELKGLRPMALAAVEAVGLLYGGVDVLRNETGEFFVTEVNSAPSLNTLNQPRFIDLFLNWLEFRGQEESATTPAERTASREEALEALRNEQRSELTREVNRYVLERIEQYSTITDATATIEFN